MRMGISSIALAGMACLAGTPRLEAQAPNTLDPDEAAQGFTLLFDGTREGFNSYFVDYVQNVPDQEALDERWILDPAEQAMATEGAAADIRSRLSYKDFDFRFDYRNDGDAGVFYRFTLGYQFPWQSGVELPIDPDASSCLTCTGAVHSIYEPIVANQNAYESGTWNTMRVVVIGDSVEHWVNGVLALGYRYLSEDFLTRYQESKWATMGSTMAMKVPGDPTGGYIAEGYVGFQGLAGGRWLLRNIRINTANPHFGDPSIPVALRRSPPQSRASAANPALLRDRNQGRILVPLGQGKSATMDGRTIRPAPMTGTSSSNP